MASPYGCGETSKKCCLHGVIEKLQKKRVSKSVVGACSEQTGQWISTSVSTFQVGHVSLVHADVFPEADSVLRNRQSTGYAALLPSFNDRIRF